MHPASIRRSRLTFGLLSAALAIGVTAAVVAAARAGTPGNGGPLSVAAGSPAPDGATPDGVTPDGVTPDGVTPDGVSPGNSSSSGMQAVTPSVSQPTPYDTSASPCRQTARACVDLAAKKAWLQDGRGVTRGPVPIEEGQPGHETPTGTFHVAWKAAYTVSTIYGIPMPHAVFFAAGGIAFHEGPLDSPSHGCVHLSAADASAFFDALNQGDEVDVW